MHYGTLTDAALYHDARGQGDRWAAVEDQAGALVRGSDYVDQRYRQKLASGRWASGFAGSKSGGRSQLREWPRTGAQDYDGNSILPDEVPVEVLHATYEAALREGEAPGSLSPDFVPAEQVTQETVGPITVKYADTSKVDGAPNRPVVPAIDEIIAPVLVTRYDMPAVRVV